MEITLCLSGGGIRGLAHLGVIKYLEEHNIKIIAISGSSIGAIIALLYASGKTLSEIESFLSKINRFDIFNLKFNKGIFTLKKFEKKLIDFLQIDNYNNLSIPLHICATEIKSGKPIYFNKGNPIIHVIASSSMTPLFEPIKIDHNMYIDGGYSNYLPIQPLLKYNKKILSINTNPIVKKEPKNFKELLSRSILIPLQNSISNITEHTDYLLNVYGLENLNLISKKYSLKEIINIGYQEAKKLNFLPNKK